MMYRKRKSSGSVITDDRRREAKVNKPFVFSFFRLLRLLRWIYAALWLVSGSIRRTCVPYRIPFSVDVTELIKHVMVWSDICGNYGVFCREWSRFVWRTLLKSRQHLWSAVTPSCCDVIATTMMHGRKKQLLNSFKADDFSGFPQTVGSGQPPPGQTNSSTPPSLGNSVGDSLNLNQPLTDQLTQRGRLHPTGNHGPPRGGSGGVGGGGGRTEGMSNHVQLPNRTLQQSMCSSDLDHRGPPSRGRSSPSVQQLSLGSSSSSSSLSSMSCRTSSGRRTQANSSTDTSASGGGLQKPLPPRSQQQQQQQQQQQMSRNQSPGGVLSIRDSSGHPSSLVAPGPSPAFQTGDLDAATLSRLAVFQQAQVAAMRFPLPAPTLLSPFLLQPDSVVTRHLEQLWQAKFPQKPMPPPWMLHQFQEDLLRDNVASRLTAASDSSRDHIRDHRTDRERERDRDRDQRNEHDQRAGRRIIDLDNDDRHLER